MARETEPALAENGLVVVPREPTEEMLAEGANVEGPSYGCHEAIWQAMIDAALGEK